MKNEASQRGMIVKSHKASPPAPTSKSNSKPIINHFDQPPPTAKLATRVSSKSNPLGHSKLAEKRGKPRSVEKCGKPTCAGCYFCKSKDTGKAANKIRSCDVGLKHRLVSSKSTENKGFHGLKYGGFSAAQVLDELSKDNEFDDEIDDEEEDVHQDRDGYAGGLHGGDDHGVVKEEERVNEGFCDVGYCVIKNVDGEEEWCLVGEL